MIASSNLLTARQLSPEVPSAMSALESELKLVHLPFEYPFYLPCYKNSAAKKKKEIKIHLVMERKIPIIIYSQNGA